MMMDWFVLEWWITLILLAGLLVLVDWRNAGRHARLWDEVQALREEVLSLRGLCDAYEVHARCPGLLFRWFSERMGWRDAVAMSHQGVSAMLSCSEADFDRLLTVARGIVDNVYDGDSALQRSAERFLVAYPESDAAPGSGP